MKKRLVLFLLLILSGSQIPATADQAVFQNTKTHKIIKPPASASAAADLDFSDVTVAGLPGGGGSGTVTSVSAGNLSPLFTSGITNPNTTPNLTFTLSTAGAHQFFGNNTGGTASPAYVQPSFSDLSGTIAASQQFLPVGASIYVDKINGNDGTGTRGRRDKPYVTIAAALAVATSGDAVYAGPGTFTPSAVLVMPAGVALYGAGIGLTVIDSGTHDGIVLATGSIVADLTIGKDNASNATPRFPVRCTGADTAFTSAIVQRCKIIGNTDGFYFDKAGTTGFRAYDCIVQTTFDTTFCGASGGLFEFFNCDFIGDGTIGGATDCRALNAAGGATVRGYNCKATMTNPGATATAVYGSAAGTTVEVHDIRSDVSGGTTYDARNNTSATVKIDNLTRADGAALSTGGTITQVSRYAVRDNNLSDLPSAATARTNLGLVIGTNVEAWDTQLDSLASLSYTGNTLKVVRVNAGENGFELAAPIAPGGSNTQVQYNDSGAFGGDAGLTWDKVNFTETITGNQNALTQSIVSNTSAGTAAQAVFVSKNGTSQANYGVTGTGLTPAGAITANTGYLYCDSAPGLLLMANNAAGKIVFAAGGTAELARITAGGILIFGSGLDTGIVRNAAGVLEVNNGTAGQWGVIKAGVRDGGTATVTDGVTIGHQSTGTPAAGLGTGIMFNINSDTTADRNAAEIATSWTTVTDATRSSKLLFKTASSGTLNTAMIIYPSQSVNIASLAGDPAASGILDVGTGYRIAGAAGSGKIIQGNGTNGVFSAATWPTNVTAGYDVKADGVNYLAYPTDIYNSSTTSVSAGYSSDTYLANSDETVAAGDWKAKGQYHCVFDMVKTAAGTATPIITVRMGTLGTTGDAAIATTTFAAGTAVADTGTFDVRVTFRTVGSGTAAVVQVMSVCNHHLAATGLTSTGASGNAIILATSAGFNSTTQTKIGLSFNGGASFSGTNTIVQAELKQP